MTRVGEWWRTCWGIGLSVATAAGGCGDDLAPAGDGSTGTSASGGATQAAPTSTNTSDAATTGEGTHASTTDANTTDTAGATTTQGGTTSTAGTTDASTTDASTTDASTTDASTTDASTTDASTTDASTTDASTTDASTTDASTSDAGTTDASSTDGGGLIAACVDVDLMGAIAPYAGSTAPLADDYPVACAPGTNDAAHLFVPAEAGFYAFDTTGTSFDSVLMAWIGNDCDAAPIACNDDVGVGDPSARVSMYLPAAEAALIVVEGYADGEQGPYTLGVTAEIGPCAQEDLGTALPVAVAGSTSLAVDKLSPGCVNLPGDDAVYVWQAPADGDYVISTAGSSFDTVLHVRNGTCGYTELACDDDAQGTPQSEVELSLAADQVITIVVDGFGALEGGAFALSITAG